MKARGLLWTGALLLLAGQGLLGRSVEARSRVEGAAEGAVRGSAHAGESAQREIRALARELSTQIGVPATLGILRGEGGQPAAAALVVGRTRGGHALVVGDFSFGESGALLTRTESAINLARGVFKGALSKRLDAEGTGLALLLGPLGESGDQGEGEESVSFDRNFPWGWAKARRADGVLCGPYPCFRGDVAAVVDWIAAKPSCFGVLDVRSVDSGSARKPAAKPRPGSLRGYCEHGAGLDYQRSPQGAHHAGAATTASEGLGRLLIGRTHMVVTEKSVRQVDAGAWVVELTMSVRGSSAAGPARFDAEVTVGDGAGRPFDDV